MIIFLWYMIVWDWNLRWRTPKRAVHNENIRCGRTSNDRKQKENIARKKFKKISQMIKFGRRTLVYLRYWVTFSEMNCISFLLSTMNKKPSRACSVKQDDSLNFTGSSVRLARKYSRSRTSRTFGNDPRARHFRTHPFTSSRMIRI